MQSKIVVAITTYNRKSTILRHVEAYRRLTSSDLHIIVSDDGSSDGTVAALREQGVTVVSGSNKGVAWNKNRGLLFANLYLDYEAIIFCDDDVFPRVAGWDIDWVASCRKFGHVTRRYEHFPVICGGSTSESIGVSQMVSGQALGFRRDVIQAIGYFDPRFGKFGHEHTDLTLRSIRYGYGGVKSEELGQCFFVIDGGLGVIRMPSTGSVAAADANRSLLQSARKDGCYRAAWLSDDDFIQITGEAAEAGKYASEKYRHMEIDEKLYLKANPDLARAGVDPFAHYIEHGMIEGRSVKPK